MSVVYICFENGLFLEGVSFGADKTSVGEVIFNTSLSGYQEIISDPSYAGQFITFTMPEIGNVGTNSQDIEFASFGDVRGVKGVIVRNYQNRTSNFRAKKSLSEFLKDNGIMGISNIDTRYITKMVRDEGSMNMVASTLIKDKNELKKILKSSKKIEEINLVKEVSTKKSYIHNSSIYDMDSFDYKSKKANEHSINHSFNIVAIDFGIKRNILNELTNVGLNVEVVPYTFSAEELIKRYKNKEIAGVFLSNGPGDPITLKKEIKQIRELILANIPMFGICLGHQLISIAMGHDTYKLKFGQHGSNHPVKNIETNKIEITSQNHIYSVPKEIEKIAHITHINLFDDTIEGVEYKDYSVFSIQHHPEASPGPKESSYIFEKFARLVKEPLL